MSKKVQVLTLPYYNFVVVSAMDIRGIRYYETSIVGEPTDRLQSVLADGRLLDYRQRLLQGAHS